MKWYHYVIIALVAVIVVLLAHKTGDMNWDGKLTATDLLILKRILLGYE